MLDDFDRDMCQDIKRTLIKNLSGQWAVDRETFHDPGFTLVLSHDKGHLKGRPKVTIEISFGDEEK